MNVVRFSVLASLFLKDSVSNHKALWGYDLVVRKHSPKQRICWQRSSGEQACSTHLLSIAARTTRAVRIPVKKHLEHARNHLLLFTE